MQKMIKQKLFKLLLKQWYEWRAFLIIFLLVFVPLRSSVANWYWVPTGSMNPTILEGDMVFVDKLAYDLKVPLMDHPVVEWATPQWGDIVVCYSKKGDVRLVKRVIGVPGDTIEMQNNVLLINGRTVDYSPLEARYHEGLSEELKNHSIFAKETLGNVSHSVMSTPLVPANRHFPKMTIPEGHYFVMGDNRDNSNDSRYFGFVERHSILGKAKGVVVSFNILESYQPRFKRFFSSLYHST